MKLPLVLVRTMGETEFPLWFLYIYIYTQVETKWDAFKVSLFSRLPVISVKMSLSCLFLLLPRPPPPSLASPSFLWIYISVSFFCLFSWHAEVTSTTCLSTTAMFLATRWHSSSRVKRSHRTSLTFHLKCYPRELISFIKLLHHKCSSYSCLSSLDL